MHANQSPRDTIKLSHVSGHMFHAVGQEVVLNPLKHVNLQTPGLMLLHLMYLTKHSANKTACWFPLCLVGLLSRQIEISLVQIWVTEVQLSWT